MATVTLWRQHSRAATLLPFARVLLYSRRPAPCEA